MLAFIKFVHFLSLAVGLGGGAANIVIGIRSGAARPEALPALAGVQKILGRMSFAAVVLLWITGIWLLVPAYEWGELTTAFWIKILFVVVLTVASVMSQVHSVRAGRTGTPPPAATMAVWGGTAETAGILAVLFAAYAFA